MLRDVSQAGPELDDGYAGRIPARLGRVEVPPFIRDLDREPGAMAALLAGALALFVAGLDPKVFSPGMPDMQSALRERPALENLFLLAVVVQAAFYLVGGAAGDIIGSRRVLLVGLAGMLVFELLPVVGDDGPGVPGRPDRCRGVDRAGHPDGHRDGGDGLHRRDARDRPRRGIRHARPVERHRPRPAERRDTHVRTLAGIRRGRAGDDPRVRRRATADHGTPWPPAAGGVRGWPRAVGLRPAVPDGRDRRPRWRHVRPRHGSR